MAVSIEHLANRSHETAAEKGFWSEPEIMDKYVAKLALIHSEVTEVLEALRKNQGPVAVTDEFADIFIRCLDLYRVLVDEKLAVDGLEDSILHKMRKNAIRPAKHGHAWG